MGHDFIDFPVNNFFQKHNAMTLHVLAIRVRAPQWWYVWYEEPRNLQPQCVLWLPESEVNFILIKVTTLESHSSLHISM